MKIKNVKSIVIYSFILILCLITVGEYIISRMNNSSQVTKEVAEIHENVTLPEHVNEVMKKSVELPDPNPVVGIGRGKDYEAVTETAITNAGGLEGIIKKGNVVLIKPNLCTDAKPDSPTTTDYRVVKKVVELAKKYGASKVIIAEGSFTGQTFNETTFKNNRYDTIDGVEFYNINDCDKADCYEITAKDSLTRKALFIPKVYMDADVVITVAKLKTHFLTGVTLSLKNSFGAISSKVYGYVDKGGLHSLGVNESIVDINRIRRPDFAVIDGIIGGEGYGPANNTPVESNIILAGKDPVALDTVALNFMGFGMNQISHVKLAGEKNVGISDLSKISVKGASLEKIKMSFK